MSLPGAALLTVAGGAVFGLALGTLLVSFASSIGATLAFLSARFIFRDWVQARLGHRLEALNEGIRRDGAYYLITMRLLPVFPFWVVNLVLGLTPIRTWTFYWASQLGMLPATVIYVYAGTQLTQFRVGPGLLIALALLGGFTLVVGRVIDGVDARRVYRRVEEPSAAALRLQRRGGRRGLGGPGGVLHRGRHQGQGGAGREAPHGRRLPQHRLRAQQGAAPIGEAAGADRARARLGHRRGQGLVRRSRT